MISVTWLGNNTHALAMSKEEAEATGVKYMKGTTLNPFFAQGDRLKTHRSQKSRRVQQMTQLSAGTPAEENKRKKRNELVEENRKKQADGNHIPPHGPKGAGSKGSAASPEWQVVNRAKRKWASVWRPIATNAMSLEAMTTDPMYTTEVYKSVAVNEISVTGNEDSSEELKNAAPEAEVLGEVGSGTDTVEFEEDWSQKWISIENSL